MVQTQPDAWLQRFLGRPVIRVTGTVSEGDDSRDKLRAVAAQDAFAYARVPTGDTRAVDVYQAAGFRVVDVSVTLETAGVPPLEPQDLSRARFAGAEDAAAVERVGREGFSLSRFHLDPRIDKAAADEIKAQWAGNFFRGARGDYMVVAGPPGEAAAFLQLLAGADGVLTIDLIAVAASHRRRGLASAMIRFAAHRCAGVTRLRVGTQAANIDSMRLYQRLGFVVASTAYVLHCHGPVSPTIASSPTDCLAPATPGRGPATGSSSPATPGRGPATDSLSPATRGRGPG
jgi:ribosomal protein S18 acetylase RimI-like enzyme